MKREFARGRMVAQRGLAAALLFGLGTALVMPGARATAEQEQQRLEAMAAEIARLRSELAALKRREAGVLDTLERLGAEQRLREAELREIGVRLDVTGKAIRQGAERLERLAALRAETSHYLEFRLRETYKRGAGDALRRVLDPEGGAASFLEGLRYSAWLSEHDAAALRRYREQSEELERRTASLEEKRAELDALRKQGESARDALASARGQRERLLEQIRDDAERREEALAALEQASAELSRLVGGLAAPSAEAPRLDIHKFRGLLDRPAEGRVAAGFGRVVHPRFRTEVPHPGLDIEAAAGTPFRAIFDGTVLFASWLRGYGLTAIVDHGNGVLSIYAHASALLVEKDETVARGQELGRVGDTGSLRGPFLYFEMREGGEAVDPETWLRGASR